MAHLPTAYIIQAADAPQHTGRLQEIMQSLKREEQLNDYLTLRADKLGIDDLFNTIAQNLQDDDLILVVLTDQLEPHKGQIEDGCRFHKGGQPGVKVAEILVDHAGTRHDHTFELFPSDLQPIRNHRDMDAVWKNIEQDLKELLPSRKPEEDAGTYRVLGTLGYIFPILFFIPLVSKTRNTPFARYHANQQLALLLFYILGYVALFIATGGNPPLWLSSILGIVGLVCMLLGIFNIINGKKKPLPLIGGQTFIK